MSGKYCSFWDILSRLQSQSMLITTTDVVRHHLQVHRHCLFHSIANKFSKILLFPCKSKLITVNNYWALFAWRGKSRFIHFWEKMCQTQNPKNYTLWLLVFILVKKKKKKNPLFHLKKMCTQGLRCNQVKDFVSQRTSSGVTFGNC